MNMPIIHTAATAPILLVFSFWAVVATTVRADIVPAPPFTPNAVLQRDKPIPVWGTADAGESVTVRFAGQSVATNADAQGRWRVELTAMAARSEPDVLVIAGKNTVTCENVVVGEVWLVSGQSNMEWVVRETKDAALDLPAAEAFPLIRHLKIARQVADAPILSAQGRWEVASPATTAEFSAVGYYFATAIHRVLRVPVGIVNCTWGGTRIEAWMDPAALQSPDFASVHTDWQSSLAAYLGANAKYEADRAAWTAQKDAAASEQRPFITRAPRAPWGPGHHATPSGLYNGMVAPLVPYALRGALWYQGENNAGQPTLYERLFPAMISGWRAQFGQGDFPFYWAQLSSYQAESNWAWIREAQSRALSLPATGQAVTLDIGDAGDVHPRNKRDVGGRLARIALARTYGQAVVDRGPSFAKAEREGGALRVSFDVGLAGLRATIAPLPGFEVAGADQVFKPAEAKLEANGTVLVSHPQITEPVAVRYAWSSAPVVGLGNNEGLPVPPFRSDHW